VRTKVTRTKGVGESIDYLAFVPDGEPTLDLHLGREIDLLRPLGLPVAVISNASLIWRQDVRKDLMKADWVSLKVDAVEEEIWQRVGRPHGRLKLASILEGALDFAKTYGGELVTETMLVAGVNDSEEHLGAIADYLSSLQPSTAYLSIPTRPPAEKWVHAPGEQTLSRAYQILSEKVERVETLIGYEGNAFALTGDVEEDLLAITAVHPMRQDAVSTYLARAGAGWSVVQRLVAEGELVEVQHGSHAFYLRKLRVPQ
jgi:wyosine [tRNA(Phe)-imidazoG37] synthetase (radical SAM superfamily)